MNWFVKIITFPILVMFFQVGASAADYCAVMTLSTGTIRGNNVPVGYVIIPPKAFERTADCNVHARDVLELIVKDRTGKYWGFAQSYFIQCLKMDNCTTSSNVKSLELLYTKLDWLNGRSYEEALEERRKRLGVK